MTQIIKKIILNFKKESVYTDDNYTEELYHFNHFQNDCFQLMNDNNIGGTTE